MTEAVKAVISKALDDRAELERIWKDSCNGDVIMVNEDGAQCGQSLRTGSGIIAEDGRIVSLRSVLKVWQLRNRHSRDRGRRFWKSRLKVFSQAALDGHDVTIGTCVYLKFGASKQFGVARVLRILIDGFDKHSCELDGKNKNQFFSLELLDPHGAPTESNSQLYRSSGYQFPKVTANLIEGICVLLHMDSFADEGQVTHDALLRVEDLLELHKAGWKRITAQEGHVHVENDAERMQNQESGIMWDATKSDIMCYHCDSSWYDAETGVILRCKTCKRAWHQECHSPVVRFGTFEEADWECAVCSGLEKDKCHRCSGAWDDQRKSNRLLFCDGPCGRLYHQKCHEPPVKWGRDANDDDPWFCRQCQTQAMQDEADHLEQTGGRLTRSVGSKRPRADHNVDAMFRRQNASRITDSAGNHLQQTAWDSCHNHASMNQIPKKKKKKRRRK